MERSNKKGHSSEGTPCMTPMSIETIHSEVFVGKSSFADFLSLPNVK